MLNIRTDIDTKNEISNFAKSVGLSASAFMLAVAKQAVREQRVVLEPTLRPTPYLEKIMREADADIAAGKNMSTGHDTVDDLLADLDNKK